MLTPETPSLTPGDGDQPRCYRRRRRSRRSSHVCRSADQVVVVERRARTLSGRHEPRPGDSESDERGGERSAGEKGESRGGAPRASPLRGSDPRRAHRGTLSVTVMSNDPLPELH